MASLEIRNLHVATEDGTERLRETVRKPLS
jgi:hypothetical protein